MSHLITVLGMFIFIAVAVSLSEDRKSINKKLVINGFLIQLTLGILVLGIPSLNIPGVLAFLFQGANDVIMAIIGYTEQGTKFVLGPYADYKEKGFVFLIHALPPIIFFSSLMSVLYYTGIMQVIVRGMAWVMYRFMGTSGAESLSMAANVFIGQTEAPLVVKPYLKNMTRSEFMALMTGGFATIAGGVMAGLVGMLNDKIPNIAGHLLTASVMSAPAAFIFAKIMIPEKEVPETLGELPKKMDDENPPINVIDAAAKGASVGVKMAINVAAMVLAFIALIACLNGILGMVGEWLHFTEWGQAYVPELMKKGQPVNLSLELILGWLFAPVAFLMGIPWSEAAVAGTLLGQKVALNEYIAYIELTGITDQLSARTSIIISYALCGFANFSCIAIQIGGIGEVAPTRKKDLATFGIRALIGGNLAAFMTGGIASLLI